MSKVSHKAEKLKLVSLYFKFEEKISIISSYIKTNLSVFRNYFS